MEPEIKSCCEGSEVEHIRAEMRKMADPEKAKDLQWFFKTGPGEYGESDIFLGLRVPQVRRLAQKHKELAMTHIGSLLASPIHEERQLALCIMVWHYEKGSEADRRRLYRFYLDHIAHINNWDLVDGSAPRIVGRHLLRRSRAPLFRMARARSLWKRRIAILATFYFIREGDYADSLKIAEMLLEDREDLIHKAAGWMLREVGNRSPADAEAFLKQHYRHMPRTMLRYAIEKFPETKRQAYLSGGI
jgi:3-methyladenine DNA glycosylase AlkD